ncbi:DUF4238 domain-containing protein [Tenacibaculum sp. AHE15PA]|uniref:DUF4238 domain-containing protein n=1 Tax=unclassified Tenacibaculum TaxID=2635139 RepID=UPI001C4E6740|nr:MULTISPECIES: DUF4238 domain-containing protein [unclassified Tenacibaculum]QXP73559.1 DUF4238 domain-containing protein [Tenacibaculum sp. AHE14PA]QXP75073.1 DUF4238 domain-containing protein [Tenacibaculum sp. AHE15PA]
MTDIKRKHHYVWKEYLRAWATKDDLIYTYFKRNNKVAKPNLKKIAQELYYYSSEEFTKKEKKDLIRITHQISDEYSLEVNISILSAFNIYSDIKRNNTNIKEEELKIIKNNFIEDIHSDFENYGKKIINVKRLEDLFFLKNKKELLKVMIYLCIQHNRTKEMKNRFEKTSLPNKYSNVISMIFAIQMANKLVFEKKLNFKLLINKSDIDFITSDQPIINLIDEKEDGSVDNLLYYYPISPGLSIQIDYEISNSVFESISIDESRVKYLNAKIYQGSNNFIFSNSKEQLSKYIN